MTLDYKSTFPAIEGMSEAESFPTPIKGSWCLDEGLVFKIGGAEKLLTGGGGGGGVRMGKTVSHDFVGLTIDTETVTDYQVINRLKTLRNGIGNVMH